MIKYLEQQDTAEYEKMLAEFYSTNAVSHNIPKEYLKATTQQALNNSPFVKIIICKQGDDYAGFCNLSLTYVTEVGGLTVFLEELYVRDKFKGKGIGTKIINFIRSEHDDKVKRYRLEVTNENERAIKLYQNLGFKASPYKQMVLDL